ncbi:MAG: CAP domain-containing protein [Gemmataceae bacterium]
MFSFVRRWLTSKGKHAHRKRANYRIAFDSLEDRLTPTAGAREQYMLELINRMRENPAAELPILLNSGDSDVASAMSYFGVNRTTLANQWALLTPAPPVAWNDDLAEAALGHSQALAAADAQSHQLPGEPGLGQRFINAGYNYQMARENVFSYAESLFHAHAGFAIDWGNGPGGIQSPAGHRDNIMATDVREVGIGIVDDTGTPGFGPLVITQDFGNRFNFGNPFFLGTVYDDTNADTYYSVGEGISGATISAVGINGTSGTFQTTSTPAGGYQMQLAAGTYQVTASGGTLVSPVVRTITIGSTNVHSNFIRTPLASPIWSAPVGTTAQTRPTFSWGAPPEAVRFDLWVDNVSTGKAQVIRETTLNTNAFMPGTSLPAGVYRAWVRGYSATNQVSNWSSQLDFTIVAPATPTPNGPSGTVANGTPTFAWSAPTGAATYDLWVDNLTTGASKVVYQTGLASTSLTPTTALGAGNYRFWVRATNDAGDSSPWSTGANFTVDVALPAIPAFISPSVGASSNNQVTYAWNAVSGAARYDLWVSNANTGALVIRQENLTVTSFSTGTALPAGNFIAWIRSFDATSGTRGWSEGLNFVVTLPAVPTLTGPIGTQSTGTPAFTWSAINGADKYDLYVASAAGAVVIRQQTLTGTTFTPTTALPRGAYTAWIRSLSSLGESAGWSAGQTFAVETAPVTPTFTGPGSTIDKAAAVTWSASAGATRYDLWLDNLTTGQSYRPVNLATNSYSPGTLPLGTYQAWVRAYNSAGETRGWSTAYAFAVTAPLAPTVTSPTGASTNNLPTFTWSTSTGAAKYELYVANNTTGAVPIRVANLAGTSFTAVAALPAGSYTAWVRAANADGDVGTWSVARSFAIFAPAIPVLTAPVGAQNTQTPTFQWTASSGALRYDLWVYNATTGVDQVIRQQSLSTNSYTPSTPLAAGRYRFWVRAFNSLGESLGWSLGTDFTIA